MPPLAQPTRPPGYPTLPLHPKFPAVPSAHQGPSLGAAAEFERTLIVERTRAGQARYRRDYEAGRVGKTVHSRSGKDLPPHRPKRIFDRERVVQLRQQGLPLRKIAERLDLGLGTVTRTLQERSRSL